MDRFAKNRSGRIAGFARKTTKQELLSGLISSGDGRREVFCCLRVGLGSAAAIGRPGEGWVLAHVAQLVEHVLGKDEVSGSIPLVGSTAKRFVR